MVILALALFAGLALGAATAVLMELLNPRVRDEDEAMSIYPLPILTRVPRLSRRARRAEESRAWIVPPAVREAFRTLAVQLPAANGRGGRVVMVTSASTGDGKTTSAINLAVSLATSGERVLLLDFDVRKPDVGRRLHVANPVSPSDLLGENLDLEAMLTTVAQLPAVSVLALAADQNTDPGFVEMLHRRLPALLAEARPLADTIIVDTAPLGEVSDALRLVPAMDDVLAVVRLGSTDRANLRTMRDLLERTGRSPRGFILIGDVPSSQSGHYGYGGGERELILSSSSPARPDAS
jgi:Mrp family chromosome partitioning ATPase